MKKEKQESHMIHIIMKQYALKIGLIKFKEWGELEVTKELV